MPNERDFDLAVTGFHAPGCDGDAARRLFEDWRAGLSPRTRRAYDDEIRRLCDWAGTESKLVLFRTLLEGGSGPANQFVLRWKQELVRRGLAAQTINRSLAAIRSLIRLGRVLGLIAWELDVAGVPHEPRRDMRGPSLADIQRAIVAAESHPSPVFAARNAAIIHVLYGLGLRAHEAVALDVQNYGLDGIRTPAKGRRELELLSVPTPLRAVLDRWIRARGNQHGPLFTRLMRRPKRTEIMARLTTSSVRHMLEAVGRIIGATIRPHGFRHRAITEALNRTNGDLRAVSAFSRHRSYDTLRIYDDDRAEQGARTAELVTAALAERLDDGRCDHYGMLGDWRCALQRGHAGVHAREPAPEKDA